MKMSRAILVKIGGSMVAMSLLGTQPANAAHSFTGYPDRYGMLSDLTRCIGCRRCEGAATRRTTSRLQKTSFEDTSGVGGKEETIRCRCGVIYCGQSLLKSMERLSIRKTQCMHCEEPALRFSLSCRALQKSPEGTVTWNEKSDA